MDKATLKAEWQLYKRLVGHVMRYKGVFFGGIVFMVALALSDPAIPFLTKPFLDGTFVEKDPEFLGWAPYAVVLVFVLRGIANLGTTIAFSWVTTRVVYDLRQAMFARLLSLPTPFYDHHPAGTLISKVIYDAAQVTEAATQVLTVAVKDSIIVLGLIGVLLYLDWRLSALIVVLAPAVTVVAYIAGKRLRVLSRKLQASFGNLTHILEEALRAHRVVKIFGGQRSEMVRFEPAANGVRRFQMKERITTAAAVSMVEVFGAVTMALAIAIGTARAGDEQLTVGGFVAFMVALGMLFSPIKRLTKINEPLQKGMAAAESVFALIDEAPEADGGTRVMSAVEGRVRFESSRFRYPGRETDALDGLDFEVAPRETVALVGHSGSGKTTLANLIPRLYDLGEGRILLDDVDIRELSLAELRRHITYVGQDVVLFNDTIAGNIAYGLQNPDPEAIRRAAEQAFAAEFIEQLPEGYETMVGDNGVRLSGGQRQRVAIARALMKDAPVLILDEATSALDTRSEREVQRALDALKNQRTTLVIAHRLSTVENADRIVVLDKGQIIESGTHADLMAREGAYYRLHHSQTELH